MARKGKAGPGDNGTGMEKVKVIRIEFKDGMVTNISVLYENEPGSAKNAEGKLKGRIVGLSPQLNRIRFRLFDKASKKLGPVKEYAVSEKVSVVKVAGNSKQGEPVADSLKANVLKQQISAGKRGAQAIIDVRNGTVTGIALVSPKGAGSMSKKKDKEKEKD